MSNEDKQANQIDVPRKATVLMRVFASILTVVLLVIAFAGLVPEAIADAYYLGDLLHFPRLKWLVFVLFVMAIYCLFVAIYGYRLLPTELNYFVLILFTIATIPAVVIIAQYY